MIQPDHVDHCEMMVVGYVRISSEMQKDNYSIEAQKRAIREAAKLRDLPEPIFFEDDERSARGEQIAKRPAFKRLLDYVQAHRGQVIVFVHTLDRWSRNVMVTLHSFRILSQTHTCTGYLDHPFKNKPVETEKELFPLLANTGGLVYNPKSSTASSCSNDDTSYMMENLLLWLVF